MCLSWRILMKSSQVHLSWRRLQSLWCWCWLRDVRWDLWGLQCGIGFGSMGSIQYTQECQHHHESHIICTGMWCGLIMIMAFFSVSNLAIKFHLSNGKWLHTQPMDFWDPIFAYMIFRQFNWPVDMVFFSRLPLSSDCLVVGVGGVLF